MLVALQDTGQRSPQLLRIIRIAGNASCPVNVLLQLIQGMHRRDLGRCEIADNVARASATFDELGDILRRTMDSGV